MTGLESGQDESNAAKRREARLQRRQTDRRRRRIHKIYRLIASWGMLPEARTPEDRTGALTELDRLLAVKFQAHDKLPYILRARALDGKLEGFELGRALFHLAQRRGFLSNRKSERETEEERGKVKAGITTLANQIKESGTRTLGEYFSRLDPAESRIRGRYYTSRSMYLNEFEAIWAAQRPYYPTLLTQARRDQLAHALFFQRPLREQSELIGGCDLEPGEKRAPAWQPLAQRFRLLQEVNHLRLSDGSGFGRALTEEERALVIERLEQGDLLLREFRKLLGLGRTVQVNLESGGKKALVGDRTTAKMRAVFHHHWDAMDGTQRMEAIADLAGGLDDTSLAAKAAQRWGLNELNAQEYAETALETGKYLSLSLKAMEKLLPYLEAGSDVTTARMAAYPASFRTEVRDTLPKVTGELKEIRNPAVVRALSELRKVVNALIRRHGKPEEIHIELARELKAPRPEREKKWQRMRQLENERDSAATLLEKELGINRPSGADIEKWRLADECNWRCPYSRRGFSASQLFNSGEVQVEHIVPFSRSLDDSFANKTLAYVSVNAIKGNRTPREAFAGSAEWDEILEEARHFKGPLARHKLQRFQWTEEQVGEMLGDFTARQLNDTRYSSKLAARYLACLYGGLSDATGKQRILVSPGQVTAFLRRLWGIQGLLSGGETKTRDDHRHHLIDAVAIALTGPKWVKALTDAAQRAHEAGRRRFASIETPWAGFTAEVRAALEGTVVSARVIRKARGALHEETLYGVIQHPEHGRVTVKRKPVHALSKDEIEHIVDGRIRERVQFQLNIHPQNIKKLERDPPTLPARGGKEIPIRRVRIWNKEEPRRVGAGFRQRNVVGGDYHHFEILRVADPKSGKTKWGFKPVGIHEAMERVKAKRPVVNRDHGAGAEFVCSIAKGETCEIEEGGARKLVLVQALEATGSTVGFKGLTDARPYGAANKNRERYAISVLMGKLKCRKVAVSPLGEVHPSHD